MITHFPEEILCKMSIFIINKQGDAQNIYPGQNKAAFQPGKGAVALKSNKHLSCTRDHQ